MQTIRAVLASNSREGHLDWTNLVGRKAGVTPILRAEPQLACPAMQSSRWGVILAGGDGARLQKLTRHICGDDRPKQFCPLTGDDSLLEQTRKRAKKSIPEEQILVSLSKTHRAFYLQESGIRPYQRIVQPANKGTAPPIVHSLLSIEQFDHDALVAILPCDHHYSDDQTFTDALESAFDTAARHPESVVLVGAHPEGPEVEYGWIEVGAPACNSSFRVRAFCEKPSLHVARELIERGSMWNTFVMVGRVRAFLAMIRAALPELVERLHESALWAGTEAHIPDLVYENIPSVNFSQEVLAVQTERLITLRQGLSGWNDLGHPERAVAVLQAAGLVPLWMREWQGRRQPPSAIPAYAKAEVA
jgi:mannose-1-phosphate guanylyltransferase